MNDRNNQMNLLFEGSPYFNAPTEYIMSVACKLPSLDDEDIINKWRNETIVNQLDIARKTHGPAILISRTTPAFRDDAAVKIFEENVSTGIARPTVFYERQRWLLCQD